MSLTTYLSFIVRIWRERSLDRPRIVAADWQSEIEHIQTGECWRFENVDEMLEFLRRQAKDPDHAARPANGADE